MSSSYFSPKFTALGTYPNKNIKLGKVYHFQAIKVNEIITKTRFSTICLAFSLIKKTAVIFITQNQITAGYFSLI